MANCSAIILPATLFFSSQDEHPSFFVSSSFYVSYFAQFVGPKCRGVPLDFDGFGGAAVMDWDSKQWVDIVDTLERMVHDYMAEVGMIERIGINYWNFCDNNSGVFSCQKYKG